MAKYSLEVELAPMYDNFYREVGVEIPEGASRNQIERIKDAAVERLRIDAIAEEGIIMEVLDHRWIGAAPLDGDGIAAKISEDCRVKAEDGHRWACNGYAAVRDDAPPWVDSGAGSRLCEVGFATRAIGLVAEGPGKTTRILHPNLEFDTCFQPIFDASDLVLYQDGGSRISGWAAWLYRDDEVIAVIMPRRKG